MTAVDPPMTVVADAVRRALAEDLEPLGDITSALLPPGLQASVALVSREEGVVAGRLTVLETFAQVDDTLVVHWGLEDGATVEAGSEIARVSGLLASILMAERTALNFLGHLSGIATLTRRFVRSTHGQCRIWDTRKTTPGLRALEKAAVRAGGGRNHRGNLSEWVLLKDNHLAGMDIADAVSRARERWPGRTVEVEADTVEQVAEAIHAGADLVLLDNMSPQEATKCVELRGDSSRPLLEVSGGVTLHTIGDVAATGVDLISIGALTHSAPALDVGLDVLTTSRS